MISSQIALKPFMTRLAQREGQTYDQMVQTQSSGLAGIPEDQFVNDAQVKGSGDLARALNLKASDVAEVKADFAKQGLNARVTDGLINMMAVTALALEPSVAVGLDSAMRVLMLGEKPLPTTTVQDGKLDIQPAMEHMAKQLDTDVPGLLKQAAEEYKAATPQQMSEPRLDATIKTASVFPVVAGELDKLQETLKSEGLDQRQADALAAGLVLGAVAYEPTFRAGLDQIFGLHYRQEKPMTESAFEPRA